MRYLFLSLAIALICLSTAWGYQGENFFIINWDGMRYDAMADSLSKLLLEELTPEGIYFERLYNAWHTWTSPAHANIHTGNPQYYPNVSNEIHLDHYLPSLLETYVKEKGSGPADSVKAWFFGNSKNDYAWGYSRHPSYPDFSDETTIHAARCIRDRPRDVRLWEETIRPVLDDLEPDFVYIDFHDVDTRGHGIDSQNYDSTVARYYEAIKIVDSLTHHILHEYIPSKEKYRDKTNVLIISDHGRHRNGINNGLQGHHCDCMGCRHVMGLLWGPDFKEGMRVEASTYQTEFAHTIAHLLGLLAPHARTSRIRTEWLKSPEPETRFSPRKAREVLSRDSVTSSYPDIDVPGNGRVHVVWCENDRVIKYRHKDGDTWSDPDSFVANLGELVKTPKISVRGDGVVVCWERYDRKYPGFRSWYLEMVYSTDGGETWSPIQKNIFEKAVLIADLILGRDTLGPYVLVAASHTPERGEIVPPLGMLTIKKGRPEGVWELKFETDTRSSIHNLDVEVKGSDITVAIEAVFMRRNNSEIGKCTSSDHGESWVGPTRVTFDPQTGYLLHDYYPTSVARVLQAGWESLKRAEAGPSRFALLETHPNPFNPIAVVSYNLPEATKVRLEMFNLKGQRVAVLVEEFQEAGNHSVTWDATNFNSGVYFSRLTAGKQTVKRKMLLLK
ncbi:MAG: T9SS type A sorting domain-containing protein [Candidatus Zixiibacteriota bacterium]